MAKQRVSPTPRSNRVTSRPTTPAASDSASRSSAETRPTGAPRSSTAPRSRTTAPASVNKRPGISPVTILLGLVVVAAIAGLAILLNQQQTRPTTASKVDVPVSLSEKGIPQGTTPEGYAFKGNPDAKVVVEDFSDYQCPHCGTFATTVEPRIEEEYVKTGKIKFIFRDFQFLDRKSPTETSPMGDSHRAAHAAYCAKDQNKFWEMHDIMFNNQPKAENRNGYNDATLEGYASQLGLNMDQFRSCMKDKPGEINKIIDRSMNDAKGKQVQGTPTFFVNNRKVESGDYDTLKAAIDLALGQAQ